MRASYHALAEQVLPNALPVADRGGETRQVRDCGHLFHAGNQRYCHRLYCQGDGHQEHPALTHGGAIVW